MLVSQLLEVVVRPVDPITLKLLYTPRVRRQVQALGCLSFLATIVIQTVPDSGNRLLAPEVQKNPLAESVQPATSGAGLTPLAFP